MYQYGSYLAPAKFALKNNKIAPPTDYLGAVMESMQNSNGTQCWTQSSNKYVLESVKNVEATMKKKGRDNMWKSAKSHQTPFLTS